MNDVKLLQDSGTIVTDCGLTLRKERGGEKIINSNLTISEPSRFSAEKVLFRIFIVTFVFMQEREVWRLFFFFFFFLENSLNFFIEP